MTPTASERRDESSVEDKPKPPFPNSRSRSSGIKKRVVGGLAFWLSFTAVSGCSALGSYDIIYSLKGGNLNIICR